MITNWHPASASIPAETSPVNAPSFCQKRFCPLIATLLPFTASTAAGIDVKGGATTISQCDASETSGKNAAKNARVSACVLYIFQFPAITLLRPPPLGVSLIGWSAPPRQAICVRRETQATHRLQ